MADGADNVGPIIGSGLTLIGGLAVAKIAMDITKELGKQAKTTQQPKKRVTRSFNRIENSINKMLGKV